MGCFDAQRTVALAIEGIAFMAFGAGRSVLTELQGILRYQFYTSKISAVDVPSTTLKKFVTGVGNCKKNMILMKTSQAYAKPLLEAGLELEDDNQADALGLCHMAYLTLKSAEADKEQAKSLSKAKPVFVHS